LTEFGCRAVPRPDGEVVVEVLDELDERAHERLAAPGVDRQLPREVGHLGHRDAVRDVPVAERRPARPDLADRAAAVLREAGEPRTAS
jgi:hypothetical protein